MKSLLLLALGLARTVVLGARIEAAVSYTHLDVYKRQVFVRSNGNKRLVGRCLAVFPNGEKAVYSGFCIRLRIESDRVRIPYLVWALRHPSMRQQMFGRGANVQNLNQKLMSNVEVPIPPLPEQDCFLDFVSEVDKRCV